MSNCLLISGVILSAAGIMDIFGFNILSIVSGDYGKIKMFVRNFNAEYLSVVLPLALYNIFRSNKMFSKILSVISSSLILIYLFLLRTRTAYITIIIYLIILAIFFLFYSKDKNFQYNFNKIYLYIIFIIIVTLSIGLIPVRNADLGRNSLVNTISSIPDLKETSNYSRLSYWKSSIDMFSGHPLFGIGTGNWFAKYQEYNDPNRDDAYFLESADINPHNDFLKILSENGIIGFSFFSFIIIFTLIKLIYLSAEKIIYIPVFLSFAGLLVFSFFAFPLENISTLIILFTAVGIALNRDVKHNRIIKSKYSNLLLFVGFGILLIIISFYNLKRYDSEKIYLSAIFNKAENRYSLMNSKLESINRVFYPVDANKVPIEYYKGTGYFELKEYNKSLELYDKCLEITPFWPPALSNYASALYMTGNFMKSDSVFSVVIKNCPYYIEPKINQLAIYVNKGADSLAVELISEINKLKFDNMKVKNYPTFMKIKDLYEKKSN